MKTILITFSFFILITSCSIQKRHFSQGYTFHKKNVFHTENEFENITSIGNIDSLIHQEKNIINKQNSDSEIESSYLNSEKFSIKLLENEKNCDTIFMLNGDMKIVRIIDTLNNKISYAECETKNGPVFTVKKFKVEKLVYSSGETKQLEAEWLKEKPKTEVLGIISFILGIIGLFNLGIPFGIVALILGIISLVKHSFSKGKYGSRIFAIFGILFGLFDIIAVYLFVFK